MPHRPATKTPTRRWLKGRWLHRVLSYECGHLGKNSGAAKRHRAPVWLMANGHFLERKERGNSRGFGLVAPVSIPSRGNEGTGRQPGSDSHDCIDRTTAYTVITFELEDNCAHVSQARNDVPRHHGTAMTAGLHTPPHLAALPRFAVN